MKWFIVATIIIASLETHAQVELSIQASHERALDELGDIYKPGINYMLSISKTDKYKKKRMAWGVILGFTKFHPKEDVFYYQVNETETGTIRYENYNVYQLSANVRRDFILIETLELFYGAEIGYHYVQYAFLSEDSFVIEDNSTVESRIACTPKVGAQFLLTKKLSAFLQTRYSLSMATGDAPGNFMNFFWSNGIGLTLRFE
jgi:hypothetical protein